MKGSTDIHPNVVLESLLGKGGRAQRRTNLEKLHEVCREQNESGSRDFLLPTIGRLCEEQGIFKGRVLYNAQSADYRTLITAWAAYAGPPAPKPPKVLASYEYLARVEDPALRALMQAVVAERDKLKAQVNLLKANMQVTVDRRPLGATVVSTPTSEPVAILTMAAQLTPSERDALRKAVAPEFLAEQGWQEGSHGEIRNDRGRMLFDVGYASAIRKVLGE